jgi:hypothetical protein
MSNKKLIQKTESDLSLHKLQGEILSIENTSLLDQLTTTFKSTSGQVISE